VADADRLVPVILSGGAGSRLWPLSRAGFPKQLLPLTSDRSMLLETALRAADIQGAGAPLIVCNVDHRFDLAEQLRGSPQGFGSIILEPVGRGSAAAAGVAALQADREGGDPVLVVLPADHVISDGAAFTAAIACAAKWARDGQYLVVLGVTPTYASTEYGYIRRASEPALPPNGFLIESFVEKPDPATARSFFESGNYDWNSGILVVSAKVYLAELHRWRPKILAACKRALDLGVRDTDFLRLDREAFESCPIDTIDYAVLENTGKGLALPVDLGWSDVGSWRSLWDVGEKDADGNSAKGDVVLRNVRNSLVRADSRLVAAVDVDGITIVETRDAVLVSAGGDGDNIRAVVEELGRRGRTEHLAHRRQERPWGHFETVRVGDGFQVREIVVRPGARLSLQRHKHRSEHWVVVAGTATVTLGGDALTVAENQSVYIAAGTDHRVANDTDRALRIVEIQSGDYLGEDDIVRLEDDYGRS